LYFLGCVLIQFIPGVSPFSVWFSILPLAFILGVSAVKDAIEDYYRHVDDNRNNSLPTLRLNPQTKQFEQITARDVQVGDILKVEQNMEIPADAICIGCSSPDGTCYINTASLDGESAPKSRRAANFLSLAKTEEQLSAIKATITCGANTKDLEGFKGTVKFTQIDDAELNEKIDMSTPIGLGDDEFYYRGSLVATVDYCILLVLYTGNDTKMMLNRGLVPFKFARIEQTLNNSVTGLLIFNVVFVFGLSMMIWAWKTPWYIEERENGSTEDMDTWDRWYVIFFVQYVVFSFMVPLSLYVTVELVKVAEGLWIYWDKNLAIKQPFIVPDPEGNEFEFRYAQVKNLSLNEELGMVKYIFSDKTGTLTENKMQLSKMSVAGVSYANDKLPATDLTEHNPLSSLCADCIKVKDQEASGDMDIKCHFVRNLLICNSVLPQTGKAHDNENNGNPETNDLTLADPQSLNSLSVHSAAQVRPELRGSMSSRGSTLRMPRASLVNPLLPNYVYTSPSPDEIAFAECLQSHGIEITQRLQSPSGIEVCYGPERTKVRYVVRAELKFMSERKRMSVVAEVGGRFFVYTKGADDKMRTFLSEDQDEVLDMTMEHLKGFARDGCRTLLLAYRPLKDFEYQEFKKKWDDATESIDDRDRAEEEAFSLLEHSMTLLGCTSVDDQLQHGVPDCVSALKEAGIRITVLTGDMEETATTIAKQANIVSESCDRNGYFNVVKLPKHMSGEEAEQEVRKQLDEIWDLIEEVPESQETAMLISGRALEIAIGQEIFFKLMTQLSTIVSYRANPSQKAKMVKTAKSYLKGICLAVGDGANDVAMIQESNVGVGIQGQEGSQAALAADFVIHRFRHLKRLLLLHGRYSYYRTSLVVVISFYKNLAFIFPVAWFAIWNMASSQQIYDGFLMSIFNAAWAAFPPLLIGFFEKDIPEEAVLQHPRAFEEFVNNPWFNMRMFAGWMLSAFLQGATIFFPCFVIVFENWGTWHGNGHSGDLYSFGNMVYLYAIIIVNARMVMECNWLPWPIIISGFIGPVLYWLFSYIWSLPSMEYWNTAIHDYMGTVSYISEAPHLYLAFPFIGFLTLMPSIVYNWARRENVATLRDILYEAYTKGYDKTDAGRSRTTDELIQEFLKRNQ